ncbi:hypothetical protein [Streptomyces atacamensis]|uniref:hypothetical protein n=1 Tax=Streptomyces atacamensis TaxID=531966 RepID=UPI00399D1900
MRAGGRVVEEVGAAERGQRPGRRGDAQLQSSRLAPLPGEVVRLAAGNPVFVLWGTRPGTEGASS